MAMEFVMAGRLCFSICLMTGVLLAWLWMVEAKASDDLQVEFSNATCIEGCTCGDIHSNHLHQTLRTFDCSFVNLRSLPDDIPKDLEVLGMSGNSMFRIPETIANLEELHELDLSGNRIKSIGRGKMFQNMSRLLYLDIGKNAISTLFHDNLMGMKTLEQLVLSDNRINYIEDEALIDLENLKKLDLQHNRLGVLYRYWFRGLKKLIDLNLAYNKVRSIPASVFRSLGSLEHLYLTGNQISSVDPRAFSGLLKLKVLDMVDNSLSRIPTAAFQSLPVLEMLTVDKNPISKVKPLDFSHLSVSNISLSRMAELSIIDAKAFYNLINVSLIQINENKKLSYIDPLAFMNVDSLKDLQLSNNNLQGLQKEMRQYLPKGMQLNINNNPLRCDCNIRWLRRLVGDGESPSIKVTEPNHLKCHTPVRLKEKLLKYLDVSKLPKTCSPVVLNLTQSRFLVGKIGERQVIECRALGSPIPQLYWILPDGSLVNSTLNEVRRRFFPPGTLVYYHLDPTDSGTYTCIAENSVGNATSSVILSATGIDIFMFPIRVTSTFVTLVWNGTERHTFPYYKIMYNKVDVNGTGVSERLFKVVGSPRKKYTIRHLVPDTDYQFCLGYEDGTGYWLEISCCYIKTAESETGAEGIYRISVFTVVCLLGTVLVITLLVVYLIHSLLKNYRHRLYETPDKSTDSFSIPLVGLYRPLLMGS